MSSAEIARRKYYQQLRYAEWKRRRLIEILYDLIDELEGRPVRRYSYYGFPLGTLERAIEKRLVAFEKKYLRPFWKAQRKRRRR
jgi:hypothetical protein